MGLSIGSREGEKTISLSERLDEIVDWRFTTVFLAVLVILQVVYLTW